MSAGSGRPAVVVPVPVPSADVVDWAAAEASVRGLPLRLVHLSGSAIPVDPRGRLSAPPRPPHTEADQVFAAVSTQVRAVDPDLAVATAVVPGPARQGLLLESVTAGLLVVGAPSVLAMGRLLSGRALLRLAAAAACPVTVVRSLPVATGPRPGPRVVVGIDGTPGSDAALGHAFRAARRRDLPVTVVHAWTADPPADLEGVCACRVATESAARGLVARTLARWREEFSDVPVSTVVRWADAAAALVAASDGAALVVLGAPGRRRLTGVGSVGRRVLAGVSAPIVIVGHEASGTATSRRGTRRVSSR